MKMGRPGATLADGRPERCDVGIDLVLRARRQFEPGCPEAPPTVAPEIGSTYSTGCEEVGAPLGRLRGESGDGRPVRTVPRVGHPQEDGGRLLDRAGSRRHAGEGEPSTIPSAEAPTSSESSGETEQTNRSQGPMTRIRRRRQADHLRFPSAEPWLIGRGAARVSTRQVPFS